MTQEYNYSCKLEIGDMCCSLNFSDKSIASSLRNYYRSFLSDNLPDINIDIEVVSHIADDVVPQFLFRNKAVQGSSFCFGNGLIEGYLKLESMSLLVKISKQLFVDHNIKLLEQFLIQIYYTWLSLDQPTRKQKSFIVHACGIEMDGAGFMFTGPSGTGKTTLAKLARNSSVLNDETLLINKNRHSFHLKSTPFKQSVIGRKDSCVPLTAAFFLFHSDINKLERMRRSEAAGEFVKQIIFSQPLLSTDVEKSFIEMAAFAAELASNIDFYRLHFLPRKDVWDLLDEVVLAQVGS